MLENAIHDFLVRLGIFTLALLTTGAVLNVVICAYRIATVWLAIQASYRQEGACTKEQRDTIKARIVKDMQQTINNIAVGVMTSLVCTASALVCKVLFDIRL